MGVIRLFVIAFVILTVIYVSISLYSRAARREKLEREWDEEIREGDREAFVKEGLVDYDGSLRRRLILAVYIIPVAIIGTIIYLVNY